MGEARSLGARREEFDVPPEVAYFNTANLSPLTHRTREAAERALERRARPWTIAADDWFTDVERLRELFARLIGADAEGVALVPATSYGFAVAARNLELAPGERIVVLAEEYPSGIYTWRELAARTEAEIVTVERQGGRVVDRGDPRRARAAGRRGERPQRPLDRRGADRARARSPSAPASSAPGW